VSALTNDTQLPLRIYGKYGTIDLEGHAESNLELRFNGEFAAEFKERNDGYTEVCLPRQERRDMEGNFIDVIRGKGTLHCNMELGAATLVALKMGVDAYRQSRTLRWDAKKEEVV